MKEIIEAVLGKLYKMPKEDVTAALQKAEGSEEFDEEKILPLFVQKDTEKVSKIKNDAPKWSDVYNKANKENWTEVERKLKEAFEIESDLRGDELLNHIKETYLSKKSADGKDAKQMTDEDIKALPFVANLVKGYNKQLAEKDKEVEHKVKEVEEKFTRKERGQKVAQAALGKFDKFGEPILPSDKEKANKQIQRLYVDEVLSFDYEEKDGKWMPLDKEGKYLQDEHGYAMNSDDLWEKIAKQNFEFKVAKDRSSPDHTKQQNGSAVTKDQADKSYTGKEPSSANEYVTLMDGLNSEQRKDFITKYKAKFSKPAYS